MELLARVGTLPVMGKAGPYKLVQLANGTWSVHSVADRETMHPGSGPLEEAEGLYVRQLMLPERVAQHRGEFVVWDIGLGAAANAVAAIRSCRNIPGRLGIVSFDCTLEPLTFALKHVSKLDYLKDYADRLNLLIKEYDVSFSDLQLNVNWQVQLGDFPALLRKPGARQLPKPHAAFFDPFSPVKNPAMWTEDLFRDLFQILDPNRPCALATYSRSTMVRVAMLLAGFFVGVGTSSGSKEETTMAANRLELLSAPLGREWLERVKRSRNAQPLQTAGYSQGPLLAEAFRRLQEHPQFRNGA